MAAIPDNGKSISIFSISSRSAHHPGKHHWRALKIPAKPGRLKSVVVAVLRRFHFFGEQMVNTAPLHAV
jgi:hypothetical protein